MVGKGNRYSAKLKQEILAEIAKGERSAMQIAQDHGVNPKTVYNWMAAQKTETGVSLAKHNRLKREHAELLQLVGELTHNLKKKKKSSW